MKARYLRRAGHAAFYAAVCFLCLVIAVSYLSVFIADASTGGIALCATASPAFLFGLIYQTRESIRCLLIARRWDQDLQLLKP